MNLRHISFVKMNGLGNDFVIMDARADPFRLFPSAVRAIANRVSGIGCDQVIVMEPSSRADIFMRILNADGSEVGACGNASRCVAALLKQDLGRERIFIETNAGTLDALLQDNGLVTVDMGVPRFAWSEIPLARAMEDTKAVDLTFELPDGRLLSAPSVVNVGNPHCIFWVPEGEKYNLAAFGSELEHHALFPERANISLADINRDGTIMLRVWERGTGITLACGTAACAAAVCAARTGRTGRNVLVRLPGGTLAIEWRESDDHILMTGPAAFEFEGVIHWNNSGITFEVARPS